MLITLPDRLFSTHLARLLQPKYGHIAILITYADLMLSVVEAWNLMH